MPPLTYSEPIILVPAVILFDMNSFLLGWLEEGNQKDQSIQQYS